VTACGPSIWGSMVDLSALIARCPFAAPVGTVRDAVAGMAHPARTTCHGPSIESQDAAAMKQIAPQTREILMLPSWSECGPRPLGDRHRLLDPARRLPFESTFGRARISARRHGEQLAPGKRHAERQRRRQAWVSAAPPCDTGARWRVRARA
jgi:hypothetical protein